MNKRRKTRPTGRGTQAHKKETSTRLTGLNPSAKQNKQKKTSPKQPSEPLISKTIFYNCGPSSAQVSAIGFTECRTWWNSRFMDFTILLIFSTLLRCFRGHDAPFTILLWEENTAGAHKLHKENYSKTNRNNPISSKIDRLERKPLVNSLNKRKFQILSPVTKIALIGYTIHC